VKVSRTIKKDATLSLNGDLYETDIALRGTRVDVKYAPDAEDNIISEVFIFQGDTFVGIGRLVDFHSNSHRKRSGVKKLRTEEVLLSSTIASNQTGMKSHTLSYADMQGGD
jgi:hypothetical protein